MADIKTERALDAYKTLCAALDDRSWKYEKFNDEMLVRFSVNGDDLPIQYIIYIEGDRQQVRLLSQLTFDMSEDKRIDGAIAVCHASYGLTDGSFDYDLSNGQITFRMTQSFEESAININIIQYMIDLTSYVVDDFNDKFFAINKGFLSIDKFLADK